MKREVLQALCADLAREVAQRLNDGGGAEPLGFVLILCDLPIRDGGQVSVSSTLPPVPASHVLMDAVEELVPE